MKVNTIGDKRASAEAISNINGKLIFIRRTTQPALLVIIICASPSLIPPLPLTLRARQFSVSSGAL
jgi:hypothetical protein